jgi:hypothetical protein
MEARMISYEDLCQALERYNSRRRNAAELAELDQREPDESSPLVGRTAPERASVFRPPAEDSSPGFSDQAPEDTHEIDVEDVMVEDNKLPGF